MTALKRVPKLNLPNSIISPVSYSSNTSETLNALSSSTKAFHDSTSHTPIDSGTDNNKQREEEERGYRIENSENSFGTVSVDIIIPCTSFPNYFGFEEITKKTLKILQIDDPSEVDFYRIEEFSDVSKVRERNFSEPSYHSRMGCFLKKSGLSLDSLEELFSEKESLFEQLKKCEDALFVLDRKCNEQSAQLQFWKKKYEEEHEVRMAAEQTTNNKRIAQNQCETNKEIENKENILEFYDKKITFNSHMPNLLLTMQQSPSVDDIQRITVSSLSTSESAMEQLVPIGKVFILIEPLVSFDLTD